MKKIFGFLFDHFGQIFTIVFIISFLVILVFTWIQEPYLFKVSDYDYVVVSDVGVASNAFDSEVRVRYECFKCVNGVDKKVGFERYIVVPDYCYFVYSVGMRFDDVNDLKNYPRTVLDSLDFVEVSNG